MSPPAQLWLPVILNTNFINSYLTENKIQYYNIILYNNIEFLNIQILWHDFLQLEDINPIGRDLQRINQVEYPTIFAYPQRIEITRTQNWG